MKISLLDTDLNRFLTSFAIWKQFTNNNDVTTATYLMEHKENSYGYKVYAQTWSEIHNSIKNLRESIFLTPDDAIYLKKLPYGFSLAYLVALCGGSTKSSTQVFKDINVGFQNGEILEGGNKKTISVTGEWYKAALLPSLMSTIAHDEAYSYSSESNSQLFLKAGLEKLKPKIKMIAGINDSSFKFFECGTSRRYSHLWQKLLLHQLSNALPNNFIGTTNISMARELEIKLVGFMDYDWQMGFQSMTPYASSINHSTQSWRELTGFPNLIQSSTINLDAFLDSFNKSHSFRSSGVIYSAGNPYYFCEKMVRHYQSLGIDPKTKLLVINNRDLKLETALNIHANFKDKLNIVYGLGSSLTGDVGVGKLSLTSEISKCYSFNVARITDDPLQTVGNKKHIEELRNAFSKKSDWVKDNRILV